MAKIEFLIIGAQKAGTTSLFEYMRYHPQIHMPSEKEVYFFSSDSRYSNGWNWYEQLLLGDAPQNATCGEATTEYMRGTPDRGPADKDDQTSHGDQPVEEIIPRRIKHHLPDIKLICILRDPVERAYSNYLMRRLDKAEPRSFDEAIEQLMEPSAMQHARVTVSRTNGYIVCGEYHRLLSAFLRVFPKDQLMVIFSDELARRPVETLSHVFDFIGVSRSYVPDNLDTRYREAAIEQRITGLNLVPWRIRLGQFRSARAMWFALPDNVRRRINRTSYQIELWNARRGVKHDEMSASVRQTLTSHFLHDSESLADIVERDVPWLASWSRSQ